MPTLRDIKNAALGGGGGSTGSTGTGGSGRRATRNDSPEISSEDFAEFVETGISSEISLVISASQGIQISWNKFAGARGYRVFLYQKDGAGERINQFYKDVGRNDLFLLWNHNEGATSAGPKVQNAFNLIPIVRCSKREGVTERLPGAYVKYLLKTFGKMTDAQLNLSSFDAVDAAYPHRGQRYIDQQTIVGTLISEVEASLMAYLKQDEDGKLGFYLLDPTKAPVESFTDIDYVDPPISGHIQRAGTYNKATLDFDPNVITGALETVSAQAPEADYKFKNNQEFQVSSILRDRHINDAMAKTIVAALKWQQPTLTIHVRSKGFVVTIGDVVSVTKTRGFSKTGTYSDDRWFCIGVSRNLQRATCRLLLLKVWQNTEKYKNVAPDGLTWATATDAQKEQYAFVHDDNNLVGSATTFNHSLIGPR